MNLQVQKLQALFQDREDGGITHPETEECVFTTGAFLDTPNIEDSDDDGRATNKYSLQSAEHGEDNYSKKNPDMGIEQRTRKDLIKYAVYDCTSVTELYFRMNPQQTDNDTKIPQCKSRRQFTFNGDNIETNTFDMIEFCVSVTSTVVVIDQ
ncbi:unnamed protein product [Adineta ricciae]|uniref:Uncharacterized protein n=1 Tax=Adineta ricciae TaxID=249248 RepID=A0A814K0Q9_ADIRI|nr:unnamed protein product [Adineta ricciae]